MGDPPWTAEPKIASLLVGLMGKSPFLMGKSTINGHFQ
jgi:hypothetical protein